MAKPKFKLVRLFHPMVYPINVYNKHLVIGREKGVVNGHYSSDKFLNLISERNSVSARHCEIFLDDEGNWKIRDLLSRHGTYLNRKQVIQQRELRHKDIIGFGVTGSKNDSKSRDSNNFVLQFIQTETDAEDEENDQTYTADADHSASDASTCSTESLSSRRSCNSSPKKQSSDLQRSRLENSPGKSTPTFLDSSSRDDSSDGLSDSSLVETIRVKPQKKLPSHTSREKEKPTSKKSKVPGRRASSSSSKLASPSPVHRRETVVTKSCYVKLHNVFQTDQDTRVLYLAPVVNKHSRPKAKRSQKINAQNKSKTVVAQINSDESRDSLQNGCSKSDDEESEDNRSDRDGESGSDTEFPRKRNRNRANEFICAESEAVGRNSPDEIEDYPEIEEYDEEEQEVEDELEIETNHEVITIDSSSDSNSATNKNGKNSRKDSDEEHGRIGGSTNEKRSNRYSSINDSSSKPQVAFRSRPFRSKPSQGSIVKTSHSSKRDSSAKESKKSDSSQKRSTPKEPVAKKSHSSSKSSTPKDSQTETKRSHSSRQSSSSKRRHSSSTKSDSKNAEANKSHSSNKRSDFNNAEANKSHSSVKRTPSKDGETKKSHSTSKRTHSKDGETKKSHSSTKRTDSKDGEAKKSHSSSKRTHSKDAEAKKSESSRKKSSSKESVTGISGSFISRSGPPSKEHVTTRSQPSHNESLKENESKDCRSSRSSRSSSVEPVALLINGSNSHSMSRTSHQTRNRSLSNDSVPEVSTFDHQLSSRKRKRSASLDSQRTTCYSQHNANKKTTAKEKIKENGTTTKGVDHSTKDHRKCNNASKDAATESHSHSQKGRSLLNDDTIYQDICCWNVDSLKEENPRYREVDGRHRQLEYSTVSKRFKNYEEYQRIFYPLILHELWTGIQTDLLQNEKLENFQVDVTLDNCQFHIINPLTSFNDPKSPPLGQWVDVRCSVYGNRKEDFKPYRNLCTFKYYVNTKNKSQSVIVRERNTFAFILNRSQKFDNVPGKRNRSELRPDALIKYSFSLIFHRQDSTSHLDIALDRQGTVQRISHVSLMLRNYDNFINLKRHPLRESILKPPKIDNIWKYNASDRYEALVPSCGSRYFNPMQRSIIDYSSARIMTNEGQPDIMLIHGAPGTGKTKTIAGIVMQLVTASNSESPQILVCTPSSITLDQVIFYIDEMLQQSVDQALCPQIVRVKEPKELVSALASAYVPESKMSEKLLKLAKIVCCTLNGSGSADKLKNCFQRIKDKQGSKSKFICCIIDEANSASEIESLAPLTFDFKKLVLVGDPMLMETKVLSQKCKTKQFGRSLFHRLYDLYKKQEPSSPILVLRDQYRTHEEILKWSNGYFYGGRLKTTPIRLREAKHSVNLEEKLMPYLFCNYSTPESSEKGYISEGDKSHLVVEVIKTIWTETMTVDENFSIGVIILHESKKTDLENKIRGKLPKIWDRIEVDILEMFQGREKDVIIFPCFPSKEIESISGARLNTALTRAIQSLTIIGNIDYLKRMDIWKSLVEDVESRKLVQHIAAEKIKTPQFISSRLRSIYNSRRTSEIPDENRPRNRLPN